ncbi:MAG: alpha/beta hydrolase [Bacteriovorax sp.]|nr:alpha/beta hydrolase [Bacteriovorax sp.]
MTVEKSKWFHSDLNEDTIAVVLIAPGLNLLPSKMDQLAKFFTSKKCDVLRISLGPNSDSWTDKFSDSYDAALEHAEIIQRPLYFLGFSLGALIGVHYIIRHPFQQFKKCILMAPATHTKTYTIIPALLASIFPKGSLPSFNLENYREKPHTTLAEYKKMNSLQKEIKHSLKKNNINIPTLLITNPKDELVDSSKLTKFAASNALWKNRSIANQESLLPKKYHHLMIDSDSIGLKEWEKMLQNLSDHFTL